jgi:hypothetical protein
MTARRRINLDRILGSVLPGRSGTSATASHGNWMTAAGPAEWLLEPDHESFWLVLLGDLGVVQSAVEPLATATPWPFKVVRREPGDRTRWCAELRLVGVAEDVLRLEELVRRLDRWLSDRDSPGPDDPGARAEVPLPAGSSAAAELLAGALGGALQRSSRGFRLLAEDGPAILIAPDRGGWVFRTTLARRRASLPGATVACLHDLLAVANGGFRGYRARLDGDAPGSVPGAVLEARIAEEGLTVEGIRATTAGLTCSARLLAPACQVVMEQPRLAETYGSFLLGGRAAPARPAPEIPCSVPFTSEA